MFLVERNSFGPAHTSCKCDANVDVTHSQQIICSSWVVLNSLANITAKTELWRQIHAKYASHLHLQEWMNGALVVSGKWSKPGSYTWNTLFGLENPLRKTTREHLTNLLNSSNFHLLLVPVSRTLTQLASMFLPRPPRQRETPGPVGISSCRSRSLARCAYAERADRLERPQSYACRDACRNDVLDWKEEIQGITD